MRGVGGFVGALFSCLFDLSRFGMVKGCRLSGARAHA
jgi:hypothetical protein